MNHTVNPEKQADLDPEYIVNFDIVCSVVRLYYTKKCSTYSRQNQRY